MLTKRKKSKAIVIGAKHEKDTGSSAVQISILTKKIDELSSHLKEHRKDVHSRRGLLQMVADRRKHLSYLKKKDAKTYATITKKLDLK